MKSFCSWFFEQKKYFPTLSWKTLVPPLRLCHLLPPDKSKDPHTEYWLIRICSCFSTVTRDSLPWPPINVCLSSSALRCAVPSLNSITADGVARVATRVILRFWSSSPEQEGGGNDNIVPPFSELKGHLQQPHQRMHLYFCLFSNKNRVWHQWQNRRFERNGCTSERADKKRAAVLHFWSMTRAPDVVQESYYLHTVFQVGNGSLW